MSYQDYIQWKKNTLQEEPYLSIIIPAYNEAVRIIPTIGAIVSHMSDQGYPWELIVVDDGSQDETTKLVEELNMVNLRLLKAFRNGGKGSAVQRGMLAARGKYLLFADADNSTPAEEIGKLLEKLENKQIDIAVGSRAIAGAQEASRSLARRVLSGGLRTLVRYVFRFNVRDTQCGFKMYTRESAQRLHRAQTIMGFSFDLEILYLATKLGYKITEVPINWINSPGSKVDSRKEVLFFLRDLLKVKLNDVKGVYANA